jgi:hypothetical protein
VSLEVVHDESQRGEAALLLFATGLGALGLLG